MEGTVTISEKRYHELLANERIQNGETLVEVVEYYGDNVNVKILYNKDVEPELKESIKDVLNKWRKKYKDYNTAQWLIKFVR